MTRFARAKGSKASNERVEEEATPWEELKSFVTPTTKKVRQFDVEDITDDFTENNEEIVKNESDSESESDSDSNAAKQVDQVKDLFAKNSDEKIQNDEEPAKKKRKRAQNKCLVCKKPGHLKRECPELSEERRQELQNLVQMKVERKGQGTGRKKNKRKLTEKLEEERKDENSPPPTKKFAPNNKDENRKEKNDKGTVWKIKNFSVVQIFREIKFGKF